MNSIPKVCINNEFIVTMHNGHANTRAADGVAFFSYLLNHWSGISHSSGPDLEINQQIKQGRSVMRDTCIMTWFSTSQKGHLTSPRQRQSSSHMDKERSKEMHCSTYNLCTLSKTLSVQHQECVL